MQCLQSKFFINCGLLLLYYKQANTFVEMQLKCHLNHTLKNDEITISEIILVELRNPCIKSTGLISQAIECILQ